MRTTSRDLANVALVSVVVTLFAQAADLVKPNIKLGLWEVTNNPHVSGQMPIPEEQLAKLPPEQRARMEQALQATMASVAKPRVYRECMTAEKIAKGFSTEKPHESARCTQNVLSSTPEALHVHEDCTEPNGKSTIDVQFQITGGERMTGTINAVMSSGSKTMTMNSALQGKWLGASCGSVKDLELVK